MRHSNLLTSSLSAWILAATLVLGTAAPTLADEDCAILIGCFTEATAGWQDTTQANTSWVCKDGDCMQYDGPILDILAVGGTWDQLGWDVSKIPDVAWNDLTNGGTWVCSQGECSYFNGTSFGNYVDILEPGGYWDQAGWDISRSPDAAWNDIENGGVWVCAQGWCQFFDGADFSTAVYVPTNPSWEAAGWTLGAPTAAWVTNDQGDVKVCGIDPDDSAPKCQDYDLQTHTFDTALPTVYTACPEGVLSTCESNSQYECTKQGSGGDEVCWEGDATGICDPASGRTPLAAGDRTGTLYGCSLFNFRCDKSPDGARVRESWTRKVPFHPETRGYGPWVDKGCSSHSWFSCCPEAP